MLGVVTGDTWSRAAYAGADFGVRFPSVFDPDQQLQRALGRNVLPVTLFVDADGQCGAIDTSGSADTGQAPRSRAETTSGWCRMTELPQWWEPLASRAMAARRSDFTRWPTPPVGGRRSAVLILLGEEPATGPDVLVLQRAASMRNHAGQPAFPGGGADPDDVDADGDRAARGDRGGRARPDHHDDVAHPAAAVDSRQRVHRHAGPGLVARAALRSGRLDLGEVAGVQRVPIRELVDPANRVESDTPAASSAPPSTCAACSSGASPPASSTRCSTSAAGPSPGTKPSP